MKCSDSSTDGRAVAFGLVDDIAPVIADPERRVNVWGRDEPPRYWTYARHGVGDPSTPDRVLNLSDVEPALLQRVARVIDTDTRRARSRERKAAVEKK